MSGGILRSLKKHSERAIRNDGRWMFSESAIVADVNDPDKRHRIKVSIPSIDEALVHDEWISPATPFAFGDGFGSVFLPQVGSEVLLTGVLGQKYNLVYHGAVYNEDAAMPDLGDDTQGMKVPGNLSWISTLLQKIESLEGDVQILATALAEVRGQNVQIHADDDIQIEAGQSVTINGNTLMAETDDSMTIHAGGPLNVSGQTVNVTASGVLKLQNRVVNKFGPAI